MNKQAFRIIILVTLACFYTTTVLAAPTTSELEQARDKSLAYLILHQNGDGSWGKNQSEKVRITATILDTFRKYNVSGLVYRRGINWLTNAEPLTADSYARQLFALSKAGIPVVESENIVDQGIYNGSTTLWGALGEYRFTTVDTSLVLQALSVASSTYDISDAVTYLKGRRNTAVVTDPKGSGWGFSNARYNVKGVSKVLPTAQMLLLLHELGGSHWGVTADRNAAHWLALQQQPGGALSDNDTTADIETALAVQAFGVAKEVSGAAVEVSTAYDSGLDYLIARQSIEGDIGDDLYKTILAVQALFNHNQSLVDTDSDGVPDSVELQIGTDPNTIDTEYLEQGNGINFNYTSGNTIVRELIVQQAVEIEIDDTTGTLESISGTLPPGLTLNSTEKSIIGVPSAIGFYTWSYRIIQDDGSIYLRTVSLRVVDPHYDTDGDGIPVAYETTYPSVLSNFNSNDADLDPDGDGLTNYQEFLLGGNPTLQDSDGDSVLDNLDNCISTSNTSQDNFDGDTSGDACDPDDDNDGSLDGDDVFPFDPLEWEDTDGDGIGNNADPDDDGDGVNDQSDNCPLVSNANQADNDGDGIGNSCDDDQFHWVIFITALQAAAQAAEQDAAVPTALNSLETPGLLEIQDSLDTLDELEPEEIPEDVDLLDIPPRAEDNEAMWGPSNVE